MQSVSERRFRCNACQRAFTRNDHLKRHQLRHTGLKPHSCQFCNNGFSRSDSLREHYVDCPLRGNRDIPAIGSGGRRRHACSSCVGMKLKCDGESPCGSCSKRTALCSNSTDVSGVSSPADNATIQPTEHVLDRGSIKFLLNGGSEGWVSGFQFPPTEERSAYELQKAKVDRSNVTPLPCNTNREPGSKFVDGVFGSVFGDIFGFLTEPQASSLASMSNWTLGTLPSEESSILEPEQPWAISLIQVISNHIPEHSPYRSDLLGNLHFLLNTTRMRRAIGLYFSKWSTNARVIHQSSFDPANVSPTLLAAVVFMGALYSPEVLDTYAAKALLDYVELFCFRSSTFSAEAEIDSMYTVAVGLPGMDEDQRKFEDLQACYLMVVTQHWAGNKTARRRAMEVRFSEVVKVARKMSLTRCRQLPEDRVSEALWLQKESRIRTMAYVVLIDCSFSFFNNYPCRLVASELEFDLPCAEAFFDSQHPYSEPGFLFAHPLTVNGAFEQFFASGNCSGLLSLTVLDMFIIINLLYAHVNTQMTLLVPLLRSRRLQNIDQDTSINATKSALTNWRDRWTELRSNIDEENWAKMGIWKTGYNYWLVAQLLIRHKEKVDLVMRMDFGADKLEKLRLLLQDDVE